MSVSAKSTKIQSFNILPLYVHKQSDFNDPASILSQKQYLHNKLHAVQYLHLLKLLYQMNS